MDKIEKIRQESEELYARIDECIDTLLKARLNKDTNGEGKSLFQMEGLMVATQQFLCWISDTLSEESDKDMDEAAEKYSFNETHNRLIENEISRENERLFHWQIDKAFKAGAEWQKSQMMREAVEGIARPDDCEIWVNLYGYGYDIKDGDKVKVIVIPEYKEATQ